ncbi:MAG: ribonuclease D, partial [Armatimonadetes bacterium]|nr:ribonuclease D [Armatimonadota bacterium]
MSLGGKGQRGKAPPPALTLPLCQKATPCSRTPWSDTLGASMEISSTAGFHEIADPGYTVVSDRAGFDRMMEALHAAPRLAVDIEADSLYHYFDKVCLIQISTDESTFVLDPLAVEQVLPLGAIFASERVETVFHAASYDTFCLGRDYGFTFARIFDTHVAAQLLGFVQLGLGALLEALMDVTHSKRRQRDDWSRRPLDPEQLEYAANDTRHLLGLRDLLERHLEVKGRLGWAREEFAAAAAAFPQEKIFDPEGFRRIKGSRDLSLSEFAALRALYLLRD